MHKHINLFDLTKHIYFITFYHRVNKLNSISSQENCTFQQFLTCSNNHPYEPVSILLMKLYNFLRDK